MPKWSLEQEAKFILDNWLLNPCGQHRQKTECTNFLNSDATCKDWKAPVRDDGFFSACYMQERTRRLIKNLLKELQREREKKNGSESESR